MRSLILRLAARRPLAWALALALSAGPGGPAGAQAGSGTEHPPPRVLVNGQEVAGGLLTAAGRIIVPMRPFFEAVGARLYWDPVARAVRAFYPGHSVTLVAGSRRAWKDDAAVTLDQEPVIVDDRMYVPLRFVGEALDGKVEWDGQRWEARLTLSLPTGTPHLASDATPDPQPVIPYTPDELDLMTRVINAEAYDDPYLGKVAVGAVIVNRVKAGFGRNIREVLLAPGQFTVVQLGLINTLPLQEDSRKAALEALSGEDPTGGALYFKERSLPNRGFWSTLVQTAVIGGNAFYRRRQ